MDRKPITPRQRNSAFIASGGCCSYCGDDILTAFEIDHVHPVSKGGDNGDDNLLAVCANCNRSKNAMALEEWRDSCGGGKFWFEHPNRSNAALTDVLLAPHLLALKAKQDELDRELAIARRQTRVATETVHRVGAAIQVLGMLTNLGPMSPAWVLMLDALKQRRSSTEVRDNLRSGDDTKKNWTHFFAHEHLKSWSDTDEYVEDSLNSRGSSSLHRDLDGDQVRSILYEMDHGWRDESADIRLATQRLGMEVS